MENIIVVGILPGPSEPKLTANTFLEPLVQELKTLWACKERFSVYGSLFKRPIKVGLICVSADIPATRKIGGFLGHMASQGCSRCKKHFNSGGDLDFSGFDRENWQPRNSSEHKCSAKRTLEETSAASQQRLCSELGARYSVLQELEYFDCIRYFVVDPMHNLYLGTAKHMMKNVWLNEKNDFISDEDFQRIQELVDSMAVPQDIGRIPGKISCSFSGFTADQWKNWTTVYSVFALKGVLPDNHLECWRHFVLACKYLGKRVLTDSDIEIGDRFLMEFCKTFEDLYGKDLVTPNMHLHGHLKECLIDYGPFHSFWCFSFERFNGILGSYHTNNRSIEIQLMRRFLMQAKVKDFKYPDMYLDSFKEFFDNCQNSGSVKVTQQPIEQYLSLQEHREATVQDLSSCDWTSNSCICPASAIKDETLDSDDLNALKVVYRELLGLDTRTTIEMPFTLSEFKAIKIGSLLYGSQQSQTTRNSFVLANWAGTEGSLAATTGCDDLRPGQVMTFFRHRIKVKSMLSNSQDQRYEFYIARVNWYSKHPERYTFGAPVEIWCNTFDVFGPACFIPVQRIKSLCASGETVFKRETVLAVTS